MFQYKFSILLAILIAMMSLIPGSSLPYSPLFSIPYLDKLIHFSMYSPLGFIALMENRCKSHCFGNHLFIVMGIFLLSALIEILQATLIASRGGEWTDLLANLGGLIAGYLAYRLWGKFRWFRFLKS
ncbi:MAG: VanZ family protein [Bacteroidales bacterium]|nr:VanZ family protein [Bacteroidales bacterium]